MKREREIKLIRNRKKLYKRYSDYELGLLSSEIDDYIYLLKSIQFPIEKYKLPETKKEKEKESNELINKKEDNNIINKNKIISLDENNEEESNKNKKKIEENDGEYDGLKVKEKNKKKKKKRK